MPKKPLKLSFPSPHESHYIASSHHTSRSKHIEKEAKWKSETNEEDAFKNVLWWFFRDYLRKCSTIHESYRAVYGEVQTSTCGSTVRRDIAGRYRVHLDLSGLLDTNLTNVIFVWRVANIVRGAHNYG